ncbi:MAG: ExbD/TolR family protein [Acidobacteriota bacterium]
MKVTRPKRAESYIPTASMADIAFLLIVFFMVTTTITVDRTVVELPTSLERVETPKNAAVIAIEAGGVIHFSDGEEDSRVINLPDLLPSAAFIMSKDSLKFFVIKAAAEVQYQYVDQVMEQLRLASVRNIALLTQQEAVG